MAFNAAKSVRDKFKSRQSQKNAAQDVLSGGITYARREHMDAKSKGGGGGGGGSGLTREEQIKERLSEIQKQREAGEARGREAANRIKFGQLKTPFAKQQAILRDRLQGRMGGLNEGEGAALRERALVGQGQAQQGQMRALRGIQGSTGVQGPAAAAQQQRLVEAGGQQRADLERNLLLENVGLQRQGALDFQNLLGQQGAQNLGIQQFNVGQSQREQLLKETLPMQFGQASAAERQAAINEILGEQAARTAQEKVKVGDAGPGGAIAEQNPFKKGGDLDFGKLWGF